MNRKQFLGALLSALVVTQVASADVPGADAAALKALEAKVDNCMSAYNAKNWKNFFKDYAKMVAAICTEQTFNSLYVNLAHKDFGAYKSRTRDDSRSSFSEANGLLVYKGAFAKKSGTLSVNFFKEVGDWKIQQVRIDP